MKYLINESQIDSLIFKYLNDLDLYITEVKGDYYFYTSKLSWRHGEYPIIGYHKNHDDCFISSDILTEIAGFFSLDLNTSLNVIKDWVENNLGFKIDYAYSDYGSD
jgi:membrane-bound lytic murein transglycosylase